MLRLDK